MIEDTTQADVTLLPGMFSKHIADNVDHKICTLDGKNTFHGMGIIQVSINDNGLLHEEKPIKRLCLQRVASVTTNKGISIDQYIEGTYPVMSKKIFSAAREFKLGSDVTLQRTIDFLEKCSILFLFLVALYVSVP